MGLYILEYEPHYYEHDYNFERILDIIFNFRSKHPENIKSIKISPSIDFFEYVAFDIRVLFKGDIAQADPILDYFCPIEHEDNFSLLKHTYVKNVRTESYEQIVSYIKNHTKAYMFTHTDVKFRICFNGSELIYP